MPPNFRETNGQYAGEFFQSPEGVITKEEEASLLKACKAIYYPDRTYRRVIRDADIAADTKERLLSWIKDNAVDQKRLDAFECLNAVRALL